MGDLSEVGIQDYTPVHLSGSKPEGDVVVQHLLEQTIQKLDHLSSQVEQQNRKLHDIQEDLLRLRTHQENSTN